MDIIKVFGSNVKYYRQALGLSQETFAEKCGMHRTYISAIKCYRRSISLENIQRIAYTLNLLTVKLLFMEQDCAYWNYSGRRMLFEGLTENGPV